MVPAEHDHSRGSPGICLVLLEDTASLFTGNKAPGKVRLYPLLDRIHVTLYRTLPFDLFSCCFQQEYFALLSNYFSDHVR